jgi:chromate transporter
MLGFVSFGGPAGQIAIMHREVVGRRRWLDDREFTRALNFCMLLPGPEALQLAIFLGWKMHGIRGGLVAGLGFIVPAVILLFALSYVYVAHGSLPWVAALLQGLQAAVVALVLQAMVRIARRALLSPLHVTLAVGSFVALEFAQVPFPIVLLVAAGLGALLAQQAKAHEPPVASATPVHGAPTLTLAIVGLVLWLLPLLLVIVTFGQRSLWTSLYLFFTKAALITFGGAYAVLGYVTDQLVGQLAWVTADQAVAGLALAETTPGPLVIVLQFMGFMAGWNQPGPLSPSGSALLAGALATWATFLPSFVFILLGAPYVEQLTRNARIAGALSAVTAAVVGVIAMLAVLLSQVVLFPGGWSAAPDWAAVSIAIAAWWLLERARWPLGPVLLAAAAGGLLLRVLQ